MPFTFTVNNVNMLPFIQEDGIKWTRFDVEAPDTGRTLDGVMHRGRVAVKIRLDVTCREFFDSVPAWNPRAALITGKVCGVQVETIDDPLMKRIRQLDKLVDELAKGKPMVKILP